MPRVLRVRLDGPVLWDTNIGDGSYTYLGETVSGPSFNEISIVNITNMPCYFSTELSAVLNLDNTDLQGTTGVLPRSSFSEVNPQFTRIRIRVVGVGIVYVYLGSNPRAIVR